MGGGRFNPGVKTFSLSELEISVTSGVSEFCKAITAEKGEGNLIRPAHVPTTAPHLERNAIKTNRPSSSHDPST
jgi:hypothetical protein